MKVSTLHGMDGKISSRRRDGNTTRLVDNAISLLFAGHTVIAKDHYVWLGKGESKSDLRLFKLILKRLSNEHEWVFHNMLEINRSGLEITLRKEPKPLGEELILLK